MNFVSLIIAIITPVISLVGFVLFLFLIWFNPKAKTSSNLNGILLYAIDPKNRSYKIYKTKFNQKPYFRKDRFKGWKPIKILYLNLLSDPKDGKLFRSILQKMDKQLKVEPMIIKRQISKYKIIEFTLRFNIEPATDYYIIEENWKTINLKEKIIKSQSYNFSKIDEIISAKVNYKGFVAFNLMPNESRSEEKIIDLITEFNNKIWFENRYFINSGMLIYYIKGKNNRQVSNRINDFIKLFNNIKIGKMSNIFYNGSAVAYTKNISSRKTFKKMIVTLEFLINKSIENSEEFVSHAKKLNKHDFNSFAQSSKLFRYSISDGKINLTSRPIRYWSTNKKITEYVIAEINGLNYNTMYKLTRNINNRNMLMDRISQSVAIDKKISKPVLVDVRSDWLLQNYEKIKYKNAIYVVNYNENKPTDDLRKVILYLKKKGYVFALKIRKYNERISLFLDYLEPHFLLISKWMKGPEDMYSSETLINLMTLNKVCYAKKVKIIYDTPPLYIDDITSRKIGLKYYYK